jgi:hypothetical protein
MKARAIFILYGSRPNFRQLKAILSGGTPKAAAGSRLAPAAGGHEDGLEQREFIWADGIGSAAAGNNSNPEAAGESFSMPGDR